MQFNSRNEGGKSRVDDVAGNICELTPSMATEALAARRAPVRVTEVPPPVLPSAGRTDVTQV